MQIIWNCIFHKLVKNQFLEDISWKIRGGITTQTGIFGTIFRGEGAGVKIKKKCANYNFEILKNMSVLQKTLRPNPK